MKKEKVTVKGNLTIEKNFLIINSKEVNVKFEMNGFLSEYLLELKDKKVKITLESDEKEDKTKEPKEKEFDINKFEEEVTENLIKIERDEKIPDYGRKWALSARCTTESIFNTIKDKNMNKPSEKQLNALNNINNAAMRWYRKPN